MSAPTEAPQAPVTSEAPEAAATSEPLSHQLRAATRERHEHAETRPFVADLMSGALGREAYLQLAAQHYGIYGALEEAGQRLAGDAVVRPFLLPELMRTASIEADLATAWGPTWREHVHLLPATERYVARLDAIDSPARYLAHAYTRYLGDLSGGQIVARMLQRHYGMTPEELTFYTFTGIPKVKPFKDRYRALLDDAPLDDDARAECADEAVAAFDLNSDMFGDLGSAFGRENTPAGV